MRIFLLLLSWAMFSSGMLAEDARDLHSPLGSRSRSDGTLIISDDVKYRILGLDPTGVLSVQLERGTVDPGSGRKVDLGRPGRHCPGWSRQPLPDGPQHPPDLPHRPPERSGDHRGRQPGVRLSL